MRGPGHALNAVAAVKNVDGRDLWRHYVPICRTGSRGGLPRTIPCHRGAHSILKMHLHVRGLLNTASWNGRGSD